MEKTVYFIKEVKWEQVRQDFSKLNPALYQLIEKLSPNENYSFIWARYLYGDSIVKNGKLQLPVGDELVSIDSPKVPSLVRRKLSYSPIPLSFLLNKSSEVYTVCGQRIIPVKYFEPGNLFGLFETIDYMLCRGSSCPVWNVSAGARFLFFLPKISETNGYNRMKKMYDLPSMPPLEFQEQWSVFRLLALQSPENDLWFSDVLFFTKEWFSCKNDSKEWVDFKNFLYAQGWIHTHYVREETDIKLEDQIFFSMITKRNLKPRPYLINTIKHLVGIAKGFVPGFKVANDLTAAPISLIQDVYMDAYRLSYLPTMMHPYSLLSYNKNVFLYYSLVVPTLRESVEQPRNVPTIITDLRDITLLMSIYQEAVKEASQLDGVDRFMKKVNYAYFQESSNAYKEIQSNKSITEDHNFLLDLARYPSSSFCFTSRFFRGCIRISISL